MVSALLERPILVSHVAVQCVLVLCGLYLFKGNSIFPSKLLEISDPAHSQVTN